MKFEAKPWGWGWAQAPVLPPILALRAPNWGCYFLAMWVESNWTFVKPKTEIGTAQNRFQTTIFHNNQVNEKGKRNTQNRSKWINAKGNACTCLLLPRIQFENVVDDVKN